jgi:predicted nucleic acid-binding Zn ribbon protein
VSEKRKPGDPHRTLPPGMRPIGASLGDVAARFGLAAPSQLHSVFSGWSDLVGEPLATHVRPTELRDGILRLQADESNWASQIGYLGQELVDRINERLGAQVVTEVVVSVTGVKRRELPKRPPRIAP